MDRFIVTAEWDDEAGVWYVSDSNVPGLATGADTIDQLIRKLQVMIPEMLELNGVLDSGVPSVPFSVMAEINGASSHC